VQNHFHIEGRGIGKGEKPFVIAEVAQAHDGSLGAAHAFLEIAARSGADAIKFQTHIASAESTWDEPFRVKFSYQDDTRYEYWKRMEFTCEQWAGLASHARERGLVFLSSPFSVEAVELLESLGMPAWKVASGELFNEPLLDAIRGTGKPVLLSSGMSSYGDIEQCIASLERKDGKLELGLFQCTTKYPTPFEEVGLNVLDILREHYGVPVGLSDHSGDVLPSVAAMALGVDMIEVHLALHAGQFGPDTAASLIPEQLSELCRARDVIHAMRSNPVSKDNLAGELESTKKLFSRSLALKEDQPAGTVLTRDMLTLKKPGSGLPWQAREECVGKPLLRDVSASRLLRRDDIGSGEPRVS